MIPNVNGKTIRETIKDIEKKIKILIDNDLVGTTEYCRLVNSKAIFRDQLARDLTNDRLAELESEDKLSQAVSK
jgi:hypothetical protein